MNLRTSTSITLIENKFIILPKTVQYSIFTFFLKSVVIITILELGPVSNESPGNCIHTIAILWVFFEILCFNYNFTENSVKWQLQQKTVIFSKQCMVLKFSKNKRVLIV